MWLASCAACWTCAAEEISWEHSPYRIHAVLAVDAPGGLATQFEERLPLYLDQRINTAIGSTWSFKTDVPTGGIRHQVLSTISTLSGEPSEALFPAGDKLLLLSVRATSLGYELTGREYDRYLARWGLPVRRNCRQLGSLPEQLFALAWQVVSPLVRLQLDPQDEHRVVLLPRGAGLPRKSQDAEFTRPGDIFLPALRRITREGEVVSDGIEFVPWVYIETMAPADDGVIAGRIHSGTRRPFGVRRRGRIEQVAIALRSDPADIAVRLQSRSDPEKPLVGYEVFAQNSGEDVRTPLGTTDRNGLITVPPGKSRVQLLYVKHGGAVLARFPVVPGSQPRTEVPLPDDDLRLQAEARLAALREELVDVVARRNILMSRVKQEITDGDFDDAQTLLNALDQLPGRSQFNQQLSREARLHRSDDPQIQRRIDRLIATTESVLGQYLDARPVSDLHDELRAARKSNDSDNKSIRQSVTSEKRGENRDQRTQVSVASNQVAGSSKDVDPAAIVQSGNGHDWVTLSDDEKVRVAITIADTLQKFDGAYYLGLLEGFYQNAQRDNNTMLLDTPISSAAAMGTALEEKQSQN